MRSLSQAPRLLAPTNEPWRATFVADLKNTIEPLFHAGGSKLKGIIDPSYTQAMLSTHKAALRDYVTSNHYMDTFDFHPIAGRDMIRRLGYKACS
jgi:hypothetical protein